jgi:GNAT superfamily N-acetyltransferase
VAHGSATGSRRGRAGGTFPPIAYTITFDPARPDVDAIHRLLAGTDWSQDIRRDAIAEALRNSLAAVASDDATGAVVGIARVVKDRGAFAWLCDVFVVGEHRGRGLARQWIGTLERHPSLQTLRRWCFITRDAHALLAGRGYAPVAEGRRMERLLPTSVGQELGAGATGERR